MADSRVEALLSQQGRTFATATMLREDIQLCQDRWGGDLRRLHSSASGDVSGLRKLLTEFPGIAPTGADIFLREAQAVWDDIAPSPTAKSSPERSARYDSWS